jgi:hypothetical protein
MRQRLCLVSVMATLLVAVTAAPVFAQKLDPVDAEGEPLAENIDRVLQALKFLGAPLAADHTKTPKAAIAAQDPGKIQQALDPQAAGARVLQKRFCGMVQHERSRFHEPFARFRHRVGPPCTLPSSHRANAERRDRQTSSADSRIGG